MTEESIARFFGDDIESMALERLYRLEIQKWETPSVYASAPAPSSGASRFARAGAPSPSPAPEPTQDPSWQRFGLIYDVHDRTPEQLIAEVEQLLEGETGRFRILSYYWEGQMATPQTGKLMGRGEDFLYSRNPQGETIVCSEETIEFEL